MQRPVRAHPQVGAQPLQGLEQGAHPQKPLPGELVQPVQPQNNGCHHPGESECACPPVSLAEAGLGTCLSSLFEFGDVAYRPEVRSQRDRHLLAIRSMPAGQIAIEFGIQREGHASSFLGQPLANQEKDFGGSISSTT